MTREEMIELLRDFQQRMAASRGMCDEHDEGLWDRADSAIASLQSLEPSGEVAMINGCPVVYWDKSLPEGTKLFTLPVKEVKTSLEDLKGMEVSVDVSTCDDDAHHRVFATITGWQDNGSGGKVLLAEKDSCNFNRNISQKFIDSPHQDEEFVPKSVVIRELKELANTVNYVTWDAIMSVKEYIEVAHWEIG